MRTTLTDERPAGSPGSSHSKLRLAVLLGAALAAAAPAVTPQAITRSTVGQDLELSASDPASGKRFGAAVAISGDTLIASAPFDSAAATRAGAFYVFQRNADTGQWDQIAKRTASSAAAEDLLGLGEGSLAILGDTAVVGSLSHDGPGVDTGAAYVFERDAGGADQWGEVAALTIAGAAAYDGFGRSVAISGDTVVVSAPGESNAGYQYAGAVYVFERDAGGAGQWGQVKKIVPSDPGGDIYGGDAFGIAVGLSGDTLVVGAYLDDDLGSQSGSAYVFERDAGGAGQWGQVKKLQATGGTTGDTFGISVAIHGDSILVGADQTDGVGDKSGAAYVFERDAGGAGQWGQIAKLTADDAGADDQLGASVAISAASAVVAAPKDNDKGSDSGSAYVFRRPSGGGPWAEVAKLAASDGTIADEFGTAVAVDAETALVGSPFHNVATNHGSAYLYQLGTFLVLSMPDPVSVAAGEPATVPIELASGGQAIAAASFSIDYDETCLGFDPTDGDADGLPDAIAFQLPPAFEATVFLDLGDPDGELDVVLFSSPVTALGDGPLATVTFDPLCPAPTTAPVVFSADPAATFGDILGQDVAASTVGGAVDILPGERGDTNGNGLLSAADLSALVLEIFDGDGSFWLDAPGGTFPGSAVGSDANADTLIDAGDLSCLSRRLFGLTCAAPPSRAPAPDGGPQLLLPARLPATPAATVVATVHFLPGRTSVNSVVFSLDLDPTLLAFDPTDADADGIPDAVSFLSGGGFRSVAHDPGDTGGELDFVVGDLSASPAPLVEGVLVEVELQVLGAAAVIDGGVGFSTDPGASFGSIGGRSVPGAGVLALFADGFESGDTRGWAISRP